MYLAEGGYASYLTWAKRRMLAMLPQRIMLVRAQETRTGGALHRHGYSSVGMGDVCLSTGGGPA